MKVRSCPRRPGADGPVATDAALRQRRESQGFHDAAGFLPELDDTGHRETDPPADQGRARREPRPHRHGGMGGGRGRCGVAAAAAALGPLTFTVETKRANLPAVLEILRQILREPTLPADDFEVMKVESLAASSRAAPTRRLASNRLQRLISKYPHDDVRYVPSSTSRSSGSRRATIDQVRTLYKRYLGAEHGELAIVGDFEPSETLPIARARRRGLEGRQALRADRASVQPG